MTACRLNPREQFVLDNATSFVEYQFRGRDNVVKFIVADREDAILAAKDFAEDPAGNGRGALVYAVCGNADAVVDIINT